MVSLDLRSVDVLEIAAFDFNTTFATHWPCPACGNDRPLTDACALKVRNRVGLAMERAVVVCNRCLVDAGCTAPTSEPAETQVSVGPADDPIRVLRDAFDTDSAEFIIELDG